MVKKHKLVYLFLHCYSSTQVVITVGKIHILFGMYQINCLDQALKNSQKVIEEIKRTFQFITQEQYIQEFIQKFGRVTHAVKPADLRYF